MTKLKKASSEKTPSQTSASGSLTTLSSQSSSESASEEGRSTSSSGKGSSASVESSSSDGEAGEGKASEDDYNVWSGGRDGPLVDDYRSSPSRLGRKMAAFFLLELMALVGTVLLPVGRPTARLGDPGNTLATLPSGLSPEAVVVNNRHNFVTTEIDWARYSPFLFGWLSALFAFAALDTYFLAKFHFGFPDLRLVPYMAFAVMLLCGTSAAAFAIGGLFPMNCFVGITFFLLAALPGVYIAGNSQGYSWQIFGRTVRLVSFNIICVSSFAIIMAFAFVYAISTSYPVLQAAEVVVFTLIFVLLERAYPLLKVVSNCEFSFVAVYSDRLTLDMAAASFSAFAMWPMTSSIGTFVSSAVVEVWSSVFPLLIVSQPGQALVRKYLGGTFVGGLFLPNKKWSRSDTFIRRAGSIVSNELTRLLAAGLYLVLAPIMRFVPFVEEQYLFGPDTLCDGTFYATMVYASFSFVWHLIFTLAIVYYISSATEETDRPRYVAWRYFVHAFDRFYLRPINNIFVGALCALWVINANARAWTWGVSVAGALGATCIGSP